MWTRIARTSALLVLALGLGVTSCARTPAPATRSIVIPPAAVHGDADALLIVDCLLPGQVRKLGSKLTYLTPQRPAKTTAVDCEIRGGEYVAYDRASYSTALRIWQPQAEAGDAKAQTYVGEIYERGLGTAPDYARAASWYGRAAEQGYGPAQINLGQLYERGLGVQKDLAVALHWYRRASGLAEIDQPFLASSDSPAEMQRLREELSSSREQTAALREELAGVQEELGRARAERERREEQVEADAQVLEDSRQRLERDEAALADADLARRREELARLETSLERRRSELARMDTEIGQLQATLEAKRVDVAAAPPGMAGAEIALAGPSIQLIDPRLPPGLSRSSDVVAAQAADRQIVGRVDAPAGLMTLTVNDAETPIDENGLFRARVSVVPEGSKVEIVAIDRRGKRADRSFTLRPDAAAIARARRPQIPSIDFGQYYAIVIGNNDYASLPDLETAHTDARVISEVLEKRYGFQVTTLYDANRYQMLTVLNQFREKLTEKDNLLIYYAGHGELDKVNQRGHWLPVDAEPTSTANWISNVQLTDILNAMSAKHIIVIADSCYSGALTRSALARLEAGMTRDAKVAWQKKMVSKRARVALTSGGLQPVLDGGGGGHSIFAKAFLEVLRTNQDVLEGARLAQEISALVTYAAEASNFDQLPQYAPIKYAGHEAGDFLFVPRS